MSTVDNIIAFKILYMLVTPFDKTDAFKLGIIDKDGVILKKFKELKTSQEKDAYTMLHRLVFSLKRLLGKVPGGKSNLASLVGAYWLVKESYTNNTKPTQQSLNDLIDLIESNNITLVEEQIEIENFLKLMEDGAIANVAGAATATDSAAVKLKNKKPVSGIIGLPKYMVRRNTKKETAPC